MLAQTPYLIDKMGFVDSLTQTTVPKIGAVMGQVNMVSVSLCIVICILPIVLLAA